MSDATKNAELSIVCTPTWSAMVPLLLALIEAGDFEGRKIATEELRRMAELADLFVASRDEHMLQN